DGPSYETPAEVKAFGRMGADVVGMSVTAEAITARSLGMKVVGMGWVSNLGSGLKADHKLSHQEVLDMAQRVEEPFSGLLLSFIESL
ncbi:MAG: purine-nucleoside phosphorylase, partial [Elusimicrobiota bacterium]